MRREHLYTRIQGSATTARKCGISAKEAARIAYEQLFGPRAKPNKGKHGKAGFVTRLKK